MPINVIDFSTAARRSDDVFSLPPFEGSDLRMAFHDHPHLYDPALQVIKFENCLVDRNGFVQIDESTVIGDIGYRDFLQQSIRIFSDNDFYDKKIPEIEEPIILIGGHNNYYHWHLNWLPRIVLADRFCQLNNYKILIHKNPAKYIYDSMKMSTCRNENDCIENIYSITRLKHVYIPVMFMNPMHAPFALRAFNHLREFRQRNFDGRKIYISRQDAGTRKIINESSVINLLEKRGYEAISCANMSYRQQIDVFSVASDIIGAHGAGLTNMIFCSPGFSVVELFNDYYTKVYWSLSVALGGGHYKLLNSDDNYPPLHEKNATQAMKNADFNVNLHALERIIDSLSVK